MSDDIERGRRIVESGKYAPAPENGCDADASATDGDSPATATATVPIPDGAALLSDVERFAGRFLAFATTHHLVVVVLWIVHTWAVNAFYVTPRLILDSPEPGQR